MNKNIENYKRYMFKSSDNRRILIDWTDSYITDELILYI